MGMRLDTAKVIGHRVVDAGGNKIGQAAQVYLDHTSGHQQWVMVKGGLLGSKAHLAPMYGANMVADDLQLAYDKTLIDSAPELDASRQLSAAEETALYRHYGLTGGFTEGMTPGAAATPTERQRTGPRTDDDGYLSRSEERLRISTEREEAGHAHLHKYVTTEQIRQTVPVTHEEVRVEREPIVAGSPEAMRAADFAATDQDVILHTERAVVNKETVPVERVRMRVEEVTENVEVAEEVRVEHIDFESDDPVTTRKKGTRRDS